MANMYNLDGFVKVDCNVSEVIRSNDSVGVASGYTDPDKLIFTEWYIKSSGKTVLKEFHYPNSDRKCEHYVPEEDFDHAAYEEL